MWTDVKVLNWKFWREKGSQPHLQQHWAMVICNCCCTEVPCFHKVATSVFLPFIASLPGVDVIKVLNLFSYSNRIKGLCMLAHTHTVHLQVIKATKPVNYIHHFCLAKIHPHFQKKTNPLTLKSHCCSWIKSDPNITLYSQQEFEEKEHEF